MQPQIWNVFLRRCEKCSELPSKISTKTIPGFYFVSSRPRAWLQQTSCWQACTRPSRLRGTRSSPACCETGARGWRCSTRCSSSRTLSPSGRRARSSRTWDHQWDSGQRDLGSGSGPRAVLRDPAIQSTPLYTRNIYQWLGWIYQIGLLPWKSLNFLVMMFESYINKKSKQRHHTMLRVVSVTLY